MTVERFIDILATRKRPPPNPHQQLAHRQIMSDAAAQQVLFVLEVIVGLARLDVVVYKNESTSNVVRKIMEKYSLDGKNKDKLEEIVRNMIAKHSQSDAVDVDSIILTNKFGLSDCRDEIDIVVPFQSPVDGSNTKFYFFSDNGLSVKNLIFSLWKNRDNAQLVTEYSSILIRYISNKLVLKEVEYYLPQLSHLIIHSKHKETKILEKVVVCICQHSLHCALQFTYIFMAAMEDYQPEDIRGNTNPSSDSALFFRCARLLELTEKSVIYGIPELPGRIETEFTAEDYDLYDHQKNVLADNLAKHCDLSSHMAFQDGELLVKRHSRKSIMHSKPWKSRFVRIVDKTLYVYEGVKGNDENTRLVRAIPLYNCDIEKVHREKYNYCFDLKIKSSSTVYHFRTTTVESFNSWIDNINKAILAHPSIGTETATAARRVSCTVMGAVEDIDHSITSNLANQSQRNFHIYFSQQKSFIKSMTEMCEKLRLLPRHLRKDTLQHEMMQLTIPPFAYIPLQSSTDVYSYVIRPIPSACRAFNTKARCPALMLFELLSHPNSVDVSTFLGLQLQVLMTAESQKADDSSSEVSSSEGLSISFKGKSYTPLYSKLPNISHRGSIKNWRRSISVSSNVFVGSIGASASNELDSPSLIGDTLMNKLKQMRDTSPYGQLPGWKVDGLIAKSNDDVRQEVFVMQLITYLQNAFQADQIPVWLFTYRILSITKSTGLIQLIPNAASLDEIKKRECYSGSLRKEFERVYQPDGSTSGASTEMICAIKEYVKSLAAYSIVTYLLAIKDRHNGNIMIDSYGHLIHIDFGFVFGLAPGKAFSMETAPWKLNQELIDVMGGERTEYFAMYKQLCVDCLMCAQKHADSLISLMEIMSYRSGFPSFRYNSHAIADFQKRLHLDKKTKEEVTGVVTKLIYASKNHSGTALYDQFQLATNGIAV